MEVKLIIAVIASCTSIAGAFISVINTRISAKNSAKAMRELEDLKFSNDYKKKLLEDKNAERKVTFEALNSMVKSIQVIKDVLIIVMTCPPKSLSWDSALLQSKDAIKLFVHDYENACPILSRDCLEIAHKVKNNAIQLDFFLSSFKMDFEFVILNEEQRGDLQIIKEELTDMQNLLRDFKIHQIDLW